MTPYNHSFFMMHFWLSRWRQPLSCIVIRPADRWITQAIRRSR
jgi:hypothetical protein